MDEYITLKCPHCGSTELQSSDLIGATCSINGWSIEAGRLEPEYCGESDVDWDSQKPANPARPYQCGDCYKPLSNADLVGMLPKKVRKQVNLPVAAATQIAKPAARDVVPGWIATLRARLSNGDPTPFAHINAAELLAEIDAR